MFYQIYHNVQLKILENQIKVSECAKVLDECVFTNIVIHFKFLLIDIQNIKEYEIASNIR